MRQAALQFKTRIRNTSITNNNLEVRKIILNPLLAILAALVFWYVLIIGNMVFDIVQRKALEKETLALTNEIGNLELSYLSISDSVDLALSSSMGFKETKATFATRKALGSLNLDKNEI